MAQHSLAIALPIDTLREIFAFIPYAAYVLRLVCKTWNRAIKIPTNLQRLAWLYYVDKCGGNYADSFADIIIAVAEDLQNIIALCCKAKSKYICDVAARIGRNELILRAHNSGCPWGETTYVNAAQNRHIHTILLLRDLGCPFSTQLCTEMARTGDLEGLQLLRSLNFPWGIEVCNVAFSYRYFELLWWAINNGCPYNVTQLATSVLMSFR